MARKKKKDKIRVIRSGASSSMKALFSAKFDCLTREEILQEDFEQRIRQQFISEDEWVPLYASTSRGSILAKILTSEQKEQYMAHPGWKYYRDGYEDFSLGDEENKSQTDYYLNADAQVVTLQDMDLIKDNSIDYLKISEQLLNHFSLTQKRTDEAIIFSTKNEQGELEEVIMIRHYEVLIKYRYLRNFLYEKDLKLVICFFQSRKSERPQEWRVLPFEKILRTKYYTYKLKVNDYKLPRYGLLCESYIRGKVLIDLNYYIVASRYDIP